MPFARTPLSPVKPWFSPFLIFLRNSSCPGSFPLSTSLFSLLISEGLTFTAACFLSFEPMVFMFGSEFDFVSFSTFESYSERNFASFGAISRDGFSISTICPSSFFSSSFSA